MSISMEKCFILYLHCSRYSKLQCVSKKRPLQKSSRTDKITYLRPTKTAISKSHLLMSGCYRLSVKSHPHRWLIPVDIRWSPVMVIFPSFFDSEACKPLAAEANSE